MSLLVKESQQKVDALACLRHFLIGRFSFVFAIVRYSCLLFGIDSFSILTYVSKQFGHVVLCAPDVGIEDFLKRALGVVGVSEHVTLYANSGDSALIASKSLHSEPRAGDALVPVIVAGIDTIDCSRLEHDLLGHSYFLESNDVNSDIFLLVKDRRPPSERHHPKKQQSSEGEYWVFSKHTPNMMLTWHFKHLK